MGVTSLHGQESSAMFGWGEKGDDDGNGERKREKKMKFYIVWLK